MELSLDELSSPTLTKADLAELLFNEIGFNKREAKDMIEACFELITNELVQGQDIKLAGFGNFEVKTKKSRPGRNPRTGAPAEIAARRTVTFHASQKLKAEMQDGNDPVQLT